ncbi:DNA primase [Mycoplasmopsis hyopharyngis]|uniref:DNA primase n=1 Tax=Mycoplasmopsis hyopharyngis TaxID=29558 RepID=UPI00387372AF
MKKYLPNEIIQQIIHENKIEKIISEFLPIQKFGRNFRAICPFHSDTNPSLSIDVNKQIFKCFVCSTGGNVISFVSKYKKYSFLDSIKFLSEKINLDIDFTEYDNPANNKYNEEQLSTLEILDKINSYFIFQFEILPLDDQVRAYFKKREIDFEIIRTFNIGYAPENGVPDSFIKNYGNEKLLNAGLLNEHFYPFFKNRMTFAIKNEFDEIVGFSARTLNDEKPKYINSPESVFFKKNSLLYNYSLAKEYINEKKQIIITEGFFDVIALWKANIKNVVCLMGTALTENHLHLLKNNEVILFLDGDLPGIQAALRSFIFLSKNKIRTKIVKNSTRLDPDEIRKNNGDKVLQEYINNSVLGIDFVYQYLIDLYELNINKDYNKIFSFQEDFAKYIVLENKRVQEYFVEDFNKKFNYRLDFGKTAPSNENINNLHLEKYPSVEPKQESKYIAKKYDNFFQKRDYDPTNWVKWLLLVLINCPELISDYRQLKQEKEIMLKIDNDYYNYSNIILNNDPEGKEFLNLKDKLNNLFNDIIKSNSFASVISKKNAYLKQDFKEIFIKAKKQCDDLFSEEIKKTAENNFINDASDDIAKPFFNEARSVANDRRNDERRERTKK